MFVVSFHDVIRSNISLCPIIYQYDASGICVYSLFIHMRYLDSYSLNVIYMFFCYCDSLSRYDARSLPKFTMFYYGCEFFVIFTFNYDTFHEFLIEY